MPETETETVEVQYFLKVNLNGVSGEQEWGPFGTRSASETVTASLASRGDVMKVVIERRAVV